MATKCERCGSEKGPIWFTLFGSWGGYLCLACRPAWRAWMFDQLATWQENRRRYE